jgi:hypothetical protein
VPERRWQSDAFTRRGRQRWLPDSLAIVSGPRAVIVGAVSIGVALLAALAVVRRRKATAAVFCLTALLSKEEAVLLPLVLVTWGGGPESGRWNWRRALTGAWLVLLTPIPYLLLRAQTRAYTPVTAPPYYRFTFDPLELGRNVLEYADRSATFTAAILLALLLAVRGTRRMEPKERRWVFLGIAWLIGGFGVSVFVPTRSSLYVCLPSIGVAIAGAAVAGCIWSRAEPRVRSAAFVTAAVVPLALVPLLHARNARSRHAAELSATAVARIKAAWTAAPPGTVIVVEDDPSRRPNLHDAFGTLLEPALALVTGAHPQVDYLPSRDGWTEARFRVPGAGPAPAERHLRLIGGELVASAGSSSDPAETTPRRSTSRP